MAVISTLPPTVHKSREYFAARNISIHAGNGQLSIDEDTFWGQGIKIITAGHKLDDRQTVPRPVIVERRAFICSYAILYNCIIREGVVVALGAVVRSCEVLPYRVVAGNPARVVARLDQHGVWEWLEPRWRVLE